MSKSKERDTILSGDMNMDKMSSLLRRSRYHINSHKIILFSLFIVIIVFSFVYRELFVQIYRDHRCMREVTQGFEPVDIQPGTKQGN